MDISGIMGFVLMICMTLLVYKIKVSLGILFMTLPVIAGFLSGFSMAEMSLYILKGIENVIPVALMFATAILFFGILNETGTFTAIITKIAGRFHLTRKNIFLMTVFVSAIAHLSGSGAVSYLIVITTCKSIYNENKIPLTNLMCLSSLTFGVMNMLPWAGPCGRLAGVLNTDPVSIWRLCIPSQIFGILMVCVIACILSNYQKLSDIDSLSENNCKQCIARNKPILIQQSRKKCCLSVGIMTIIIILLIITRISSWIVFMMGLSVISIINLKRSKENGINEIHKISGNHGRNSFGIRRYGWCSDTEQHADKYVRNDIWITSGKHERAYTYFTRGAGQSHKLDHEWRSRNFWIHANCCKNSIRVSNSSGSYSRRISDSI